MSNVEAGQQLAAIVDGLCYRSSLLTIRKEIFHHASLLRDRRLRLRTIHNCMQGDEVVEALVQHMLLTCRSCEMSFAKGSADNPPCPRCKAAARAATRPEAIRFAEGLTSVGMLPSVQGQAAGFKDGKNLYHFGTYMVWSRAEVVVVDEQKASQNIPIRSVISFPEPLFSSEKAHALMRSLRTKRLLDQ